MILCRCTYLIIYIFTYIYVLTQVSVCGGVNEYTHFSAVLVGMIGCIIYLVLQWVVPLLKGINIIYIYNLLNYVIIMIFKL